MLSQTLVAWPGQAQERRWNTGYDYDGVNRLNSAVEASSAPGLNGWTQSYGYDQFGNPTVSGTEVVPAALPCLWFEPATNRCSGSGFGYNTAGNLTAQNATDVIRTLEFDAENRLTALIENGARSDYTYDGEGRRVKKTNGTASLIYVYDGMGQLAAEYDSAPPAAPPCATCYLTADHLGSTRLITDGTTGAVTRRYDYLPFGWQIDFSYNGRDTVAGYVMSDVTNPKFTGKERDYESSLGLDYFGARYFSGAQGRFTSPDEPFVDQSPLNPQSWNFYSYGRNNPLRYVDPTGRKCVETSNGPADDGTGGGCERKVSSGRCPQSPAEV